jgi:hypothetical protein
LAWNHCAKSKIFVSFLQAHPKATFQTIGMQKVDEFYWKIGMTNWRSLSSLAPSTTNGTYSPIWGMFKMATIS